MPSGSFTADITAIRKRARQKMEYEPVTGSYGKEEHADDLVDLLGK